MASIKYGEILEYLIEKASSVYPSKPGVTAERVLLAMIYESNKGEFKDAVELTDALDYLIKKSVDIKRLTYAVIDYLKMSNFNMMKDRQYYRNLISAMEEHVQKEERGEAFLLDFVTVYYEHPNKFLKDFMENKEEPSCEELMEKYLEVMNKTDSEDKIAISEPQSVSNSLANTAKSSKTVRDRLLEIVFGQNHAVDVVTSAIFSSEVARRLPGRPHKPKGVFLFAGPPGVGKTYLSESLAKILKLPCKRFDMSEYNEKEDSVLRLIGLDNAWRNSHPGTLTSFVKDNPDCVLIFDEIEKAHTDVIHLFLQMLDGGVLQDACTEKKVFFYNTYIIMTTNAGRQLYDNGETDFSNVSGKVIIDALQKDINPQTLRPYFPAAICSRLGTGNVVMFNHIKVDSIYNIIRKELEKRCNDFKIAYGIDIKAADSNIISAIMFAQGTLCDARTACAKADSFINTELYDLFRLETFSENNEVIDNVHFSVEIPDDKKVRKLFVREDKPNVIICADDSVKKKITKHKSHKEINFIFAKDENEIRRAYVNDDIDFVILDICYGMDEAKSRYMSIEDIDSAFRHNFSYIKSNLSSLPVYLINSENYKISKEEYRSLESSGVVSMFDISDCDTFISEVAKSCVISHRQRCFDELARANKVLEFESAQTYNSEDKSVEISLIDLKLSTAVDAEDSNRVLSNVMRPDVKFSDVLGLDSVKKELEFFKQYFLKPREYLRKGFNPPKGLLLYGPPGTGKTMIAKALAGESDVTFLQTTGNDFQKGNYSESVDEVKRVFRTARKYAPSVIFIDEIDAVARNRMNNSSTSDAQLLNAFLTEMDGFSKDPSKPVLVLGATNFDVYNGSLDPALMRRFDRKIYISLPVLSDRRKYLTDKTQKEIFDVSEDIIENIAIRSVDMSLAELEGVVDLAMRTAGFEGSDKVTDEIFENAFETFNIGEKRSTDVTNIKRIACHESGHALMCCLGGNTPVYVTIVSRGDAGGYVMPEINEESHVLTRSEMLNKIRISLGGRAAEIVCYGEEDGLSIGASSDLNKATRIAKAIIMAYGMYDDFGMSTDISLVSPEKLKEKIDSILKTELNNAIELIKQNRDKLDALCDELIKKNRLMSKEIESIVNIKGE